MLDAPLAGTCVCASLNLWWGLSWGRRLCWIPSLVRLFAHLHMHTRACPPTHPPTNSQGGRRPPAPPPQGPCPNSIHTHIHITPPNPPPPHHSLTHTYTLTPPLCNVHNHHHHHHQRRQALLSQQRAAHAAATARLTALDARLQRASASAAAAGKEQEREVALKAAVAKKVEAAYAPQLASLRAMRVEVCLGLGGCSWLSVVM
jgi:hypothetical protein